jgi:hypothetical protein
VILDVLVMLYQCCAGGDVIPVLSIYNVGGKLFVLCWSFLICIVILDVLVMLYQC